jgi:hypothetical protein
MLRLRGPAILRKTICFPASDRGAHVTLPHIDGEIRGRRHHMQVRVYYEDTDFPAPSYDDGSRTMCMFVADVMDAARPRSK